MKTSSKKFSITMHPELLDRVDKFAAENYQTRSGLISIALKQFLDNQAAISQMGKLSDMMSDLKEIAAIAQQQPQQPQQQLSKK